jgi:hypothetical protein
MPANNGYSIPILCIHFLIVFCVPAMPDETPLHLGDPPILDGILEDEAWLPIGNIGGLPGYDNVVFIYDTIPQGGGSLIPPGVVQGGDDDPPLNFFVMQNPSIERASGLNLWGLGIAYHQLVDDGSYFFALDLPGSSNPNISSHFCNNGDIPIAWDSDGDGDEITWDPTVIRTDIGFADDLYELYRIILNLGATVFDLHIEDPATIGNGLPLEIRLYSISGTSSGAVLEARIPSSHSISGNPIDVSDFMNPVIGGVKSDPSQGIFDIELQLRNLRSLLQLPEIDWNMLQKHPGIPLEEYELSSVAAVVMCDSMGDCSLPELLGHLVEFPFLFPIDVDVAKKVGCGDCGHKPDVLKDLAYAIPDTKVRFEIEISIPLTPDPPLFPENGLGEIHGSDALIDPEGAVEAWQLCIEEITVNGQTDRVVIPGFNLHDQEWTVLDAATVEPYPFEPGDVLVIPLEMKIKETYKSMNLPEEIGNCISVWGINPVTAPGSPYPVASEEAWVDVLIPDSSCEADVLVVDKHGKKWSNKDQKPFDELTLDWDAQGFVFPLDVQWGLAIFNPGETGRRIVQFSDPELEKIGWKPPEVPLLLAPGQEYGESFSLRIHGWKQWRQITNQQETFAHELTVESSVRENDPAFELICSYEDYGMGIHSSLYHSTDQSALKLVLIPPSVIQEADK